MLYKRHRTGGASSPGCPEKAVLIWPNRPTCTERLGYDSGRVQRSTDESATAEPVLFVSRAPRRPPWYHKSLPSVSSLIANENSTPRPLRRLRKRSCRAGAYTTARTEAGFKPDSTEISWTLNHEFGDITPTTRSRCEDPLDDGAGFPAPGVSPSPTNAAIACNPARAARYFSSIRSRTSFRSSLFIIVLSS